MRKLLICLCLPIVAGLVWQGCGSKMSMPELKNTTWILKGLGTKIIPNEITMSLTFRENNEISVSGTCNAGSGGYSISAAKLQIDDLTVSTRACSELAWETEYIQWLSSGGALHLDNNNSSLDITTERGKMHFRLGN